MTKTIVKKESVKKKKVAKIHAQECDSDSSHDQKWKQQNVNEIDDLDNEIVALERKLGLKTDKKRRDR